MVCCVCTVLNSRPSKARMYFLLSIFVHHLSQPNWCNILTSPLPRRPSSVVCCISWSISGHLKPRTSPYWYVFCASYSVTPNKGKAVTNANLMVWALHGPMVFRDTISYMHILWCTNFHPFLKSLCSIFFYNSPHGHQISYLSAMLRTWFIANSTGPSWAQFMVGVVTSLCCKD